MTQIPTETMGKKLLYVHKPIPRLDAEEKVTGKAIYGQDITIPGMLYAKIRRSPLPHAKIKRIDITESLKVQGIKAVITAEDLPRLLYGRGLDDRPVIARDVVRYVGEPVAAVAAESLEAAEEAADLIKVEYDEMPAVFDPQESMVSDPHVIIHPDLEKYRKTRFTVGPATDIPRPNVHLYTRVLRGELEKGFAESDLTVENRFSTPMIHHCNLETHSCLARVEDDGSITLWTENQLPYYSRDFLSQLFNLSPSKIRVVLPCVGGAFGNKMDPIIEPLCIALALKARRPVKLVLTREEEFTATSVRHNVVVYLKDGVKRDGTISAREIKIILNGGAYSGSGYIVARNSVYAAMTYKIPNIKIESFRVYTNLVPAGAFRGFGIPQVTWAIESQMDIIAEKLGIDPVELRLKNVLHEQEESVFGEVVQSFAAEQCLRKAAASIGWRKGAAKERPRRAVLKRGIGIALGVKHSSAHTDSEVRLKLSRDGIVEVLTSTVELGQGTYTGLAQIVAEELKIPLHHVNVTGGDSAVTPYDDGAFSSRQLYSAGKAVTIACRDMKNRILQEASETLQIDTSQLELSNGFVRTKIDRRRTIALGTLVAHTGELTASGRWHQNAAYPDPQTGRIEVGKKIVSFWTPVAQAAEVEVDIETGEVRVLNFVSACDIGKAINPTSVEGQMEGGAAMGIGSTLYEELVANQGQILNADFLDYKVPEITNLPDSQMTETILVESDFAEGPFGAKGVGEAAMVAAAPAIANAVNDATGLRFYDLPITSERVWRAAKSLPLSYDRRSAPKETRPFRPKQYLRPTSLKEALAILGTHGAMAKPIAGGTDLLVERPNIEYLVDIARLRLNRITEKKDTVTVGSLATYSQVLASKLFKTGPMKVVGEAALKVGNGALRNTATLGGNLCDAVPSADMPPPLIALNAKVRLQSARSSRVLQLDKFFVGVRETALQPDELLTEIIIPKSLRKTGTAFAKLMRTDVDLALVNVAVCLTFGKKNVVEDARIVLGAVAPTPLRAEEGERILKGRELSGNLIEKAAQLASESARPISDLRASAQYRRDMVRVLVKRTLLQAQKRAIGKGGNHC